MCVCVRVCSDVVYNHVLLKIIGGLLSEELARMQMVHSVTQYASFTFKMQYRLRVTFSIVKSPFSHDNSPTLCR